MYGFFLTTVGIIANTFYAFLIVDTKKDFPVWIKAVLLIPPVSIVTGFGYGVYMAATSFYDGFRDYFKTSKN